MDDVLERLRAQSGTEVGVSEWVVIDQDRIDAFAGATGDHQWIHVDPDRARGGPFGTTIAHGFLTLSLIPGLLADIELPVGSPRLTINYGLDRVRFTGPVVSGTRVRARMVLDSATEVPGGIQVKRTVTVEREGEERPALVAETLVRFLY